MESVVPGLHVTAKIGRNVWLTEEVDHPESSVASSGRGEWAVTLGFEINYRDEHYSGFGHASAGSEREQILAVVLQLMSEVQDLVSETTTEPWPPIVVNGSRDMAMPDAAIDQNDLDMWYGDRNAPALRLPSVSLVDDAG